MSKIKPFYILWHPQGDTPPRATFAKLADAKRTAETMMNKIGRGTMYVLKCVDGYETVQRQNWLSGVAKEIK